MTHITVIKTALWSRAVVITIQYFANILVPDHQPDIFYYPKSNLPTTISDKVINNIFNGFVRWDGQYFMHITQFGYTYENCLAFFPLLPLITRGLGYILYVLLSPILNWDSILLISFVTINTICFILSAGALYDLTLLLLGQNHAIAAVVLFNYNPASVFFSAPYTESLFSYLSFKSMLNSILLYNDSKNCNLRLRQLILVIFPVGLSTITRSNGILNAGFLVYTLVSLFIVEKFKFQFVLVFKYVATIIVSVILCLLPFIMFQYYCYKRFCTTFDHKLNEFIVDYGEINNFVLPGTFTKHNQSWCFHRIPLAYSYVQSHYWDVGFFKYWQFKQIPNFLLAVPIITIMMHGTFIYKKMLKFRFLFDLNPSLKTFNNNPSLLVFVVHGIFLTIFCLFTVHIQVTTRMICSACPVFYWFVTNLLPDVQFWSNVTFTNKIRFVIMYFLTYFSVGIVMFCNHLPWT